MPLTPLAIFGHATPVVQVSMVILLAAAVLALVILIRALVSRAASARGVDVLAAIVAAAPLLGAFAAAYGLLNMCVGLANAASAPPIKVLAPGFAEAVAAIALGLFAAAVAAIFRGALRLRPA